MNRCASNVYHAALLHTFRRISIIAVMIAEATVRVRFSLPLILVRYFRANRDRSALLIQIQSSLACFVRLEASLIGTIDSAYPLWA